MSFALNYHARAAMGKAKPIAPSSEIVAGGIAAHASFAVTSDSVGGVFFIVEGDCNRTIQEVDEVHQTWLLALKRVSCEESGKRTATAFCNCKLPVSHPPQPTKPSGFSTKGTRLELRVPKSLRPNHADGELVQFAWQKSCKL